MATIAFTTDPDIERRARRRAGALLGWITHASVFVLVTLFLAVVANLQGHAFRFPGTLGWGFGVLVHGLVVLAYSGGLMDRMVRRERARLLSQRDPW